jgi:hypothetical protein
MYQSHIHKTGRSRKKNKKNERVIYSDFTNNQCTEFTAYLQTPSGLSVDGKMALQQGQKLRQVLQGINLSNVNDLISGETIKTIKNWMKN